MAEVKSSQSTEKESFESLLDKARTASPELVVTILRELIARPDICFFGEFLELSSVQSLESTSHGNIHKLLHIFAYGTWRDYIVDDTLPKLTSIEIAKLKQLSVVSLASRSKSLKYSDLQTALDLTTPRAVEDIVIGAIDRGLIEAVLDPRASLIRVTSCVGRDLSPTDMEEMSETLANWLNTVEKAVVLGQRTAATTSQDALGKLDSLERTVGNTVTSMLPLAITNTSSSLNKKRTSPSEQA